MKRFLLAALFALLLACPITISAQGVYGMIGYGISKFVYRPANLDIVRYNIDKGASTPMKFPDYLRGMSYGLKLEFNDYTAGEFFFSRRKAEGKVIDSLGNIYELRSAVSAFSFGGSFGLRFAKIGVAFNMGTFTIASRQNNAQWEATFEQKRKLWFGHSVYMSLMMHLGSAFLFELRPYWDVSWFSVRMGHTLPLVAFRPSNYGLTIAIGLGQSE